MRKMIVSCAAVLLAVSAYADEVEKEKDVVESESVTTSMEDSFEKEYGCSKCGGKTKK